MAGPSQRYLLALLLLSGAQARSDPAKAEDAKQNRGQNALPEFDSRLQPDTRLLRLSELSWKNCGTDHDPIQLRTLTLPKVVNLKAAFNLTADVVLGRQLRSPIKVTNTVDRHFLFWWVKVPCLGMFGSCTFPDACQVAHQLFNGTCPPPLVDNHIPCSCPLGPAEYSVLDVPVDLSHVKIPEELAAGKYQIKVDIEDRSGDHLGCFIVNLTLE